MRLHFVLIVLQILPVLIPRFKRLIVAVVWFFLRSGLEIVIMLDSAIRFVVLSCFFDFVSHFVRSHFPVCFLSTDMHCKTRPARALRPPFALFPCLPVLPHPTSPIRSNPYPSACICVPFHRIPKNIMSGEISPAIASQKSPARSILILSALFLCPPVPPVPIRTHPHPSTIIFTCLYAFVP